MDKKEKRNYYTTKTLLNSYIINKSDIVDLELENKMLINNFDVQAIKYQETMGKTFKVKSLVEETSENNTKRIEENKTLIKIKQYNIDRIDNALTVLDNKFEKDVIVSKYLKNKTNSWKDVGNELNYSAETCRKASKRAIEKLSKFLFK